MEWRNEKRKETTACELLCVIALQGDETTNENNHYAEQL